MSLQPQWGRNFIVAETWTMPAGVLMCWSLLQWGRNFIVAETYWYRHSLSPQYRRFNGAATLSLRKLIAEGTMACIEPRFNGAATLSLRKLQEASGSGRRAYAASMGPQLYRCGNTDAGATPAVGIKLQWGRNFIVAETVILQTITEARHPLQWGRNFIVAETRRAPATCTPCQRLQWGRNFIVAETKRWRTAKSRRRKCFNGAATLSLRKLTPRLRHAIITGLLQWGRNFIVAETRTTTTTLPGYP